MKCRKCGSEISDGNIFCNTCGEKIDIAPIVGEDIDSSQISNNDGTVNSEGETEDGVEKTSPTQPSSDYQENNENTLKSTNSTTQTDSISSSSKTKSKQTTLIIIASAAVIFFILIFAAIFSSIATKRSSNNGNAIDESISINELENTTLTKATIMTMAELENTTLDLRIPVIDVTDMEYSDAILALNEAGFTNINANIDSPASNERWIVISQSLPAGENALPSDLITLTCVKHCFIYLDITSVGNIFFDKYSIKVSLDGTELGSVANGEIFTHLADVECGEHTIEFKNVENSSIKSTKTLDLQRDTTYTCTLTHDVTAIGITKENTENNINKASLVMMNVLNIPLSDAKSKLKNAGFTNITSDPSDIWGESDWIVTSQSVAAGICIDKNAPIVLGCVQGNNYFADYIGKNANECEKMASGKWYTICFMKDAVTGWDLSQLDEKGKANYVVSSVIYLGAFKNLNLYLQYVGPTHTPTPKPTQTPTPIPTTRPTSTTGSGSNSGSSNNGLYYTSNDKDTYKDGDTGVYSYRKNAGSYDIYVIIDFDDGYIYYFCEGNGDEICDRLEIDEGDLNSVCIFYYYQGEDDEAAYAVNWAWKRQPDHLIMQDTSGNKWDFYPCNLEEAIELRDTKEIVDY